MMAQQNSKIWKVGEAMKKFLDNPKTEGKPFHFRDPVMKLSQKHD